MLILRNGNRVFFSYETPVAAWIAGKGFIMTDQKFSVTTTQHINRWLNGVYADPVSQASIERLL